MKAFLYHEYGSPDVMRLEEVEKPTPKENEVLVKIHAVSVNYADWIMLTGLPVFVRPMFGGIRAPNIKILGVDIAGRVETAGKNVREFQRGDEVFADISTVGRGGFAEYAAVPAKMVVLKPKNLSFEEASAVPLAAVTALQGLRDKGQLREGQTVLINGATGGVGSFAVQIAKAYGAHVTGVCSPKKMDFVRSLGADGVIDYTKQDFTTDGQQYDLILGANGNHSLSDYARALRPGGVYVCSGGAMSQIFGAMLLGPLWSRNGKQLVNVAQAPNQKDLQTVKELIESGKVIPIVDRCYPFTQTPEAVRYLGQVHPRGKVVISV